MTDSMKCPHCKKEVIPKVTRGTSGMQSRICPLCGKNVESILNQDADQVTFKVSPKIALIVLGVLVLIIIIALLIPR